MQWLILKSWQTIFAPVDQKLKEQLDQKCVAGPQLLMEDPLTFINFSRTIRSHPSSLRSYKFLKITNSCSFGSCQLLIL